MNENFRDNLLQIKPYVPGEQPKNKNIIKLNANENPYPPSPDAIKSIKSYRLEDLRLYPDANTNALVEAVSKKMHVSKNQVLITNGSDEALAFIFMACFNSNKPILFPDITYSFYPVWCSLFKTPYKTVPLDADFNICPPDYTVENGGILLPNPNAPTGIGQAKQAIVDILDANKGSIVVIDEAYVDFGAYSAVELLDKYENLVIVQTFSKSRSLAGMRIGMALGSPEVIKTISAVKNSYNSYTCDSLAIAAGTASINDDKYFLETLEKIKTARQYTADNLIEMGFKVYASESNFLFVTHNTINAKQLFEALKEKDIYIRHFDLPRIDNHLRITVGTLDDMNRLINEIKQYMENKKL